MATNEQLIEWLTRNHIQLHTNAQIKSHDDNDNDDGLGIYLSATSSTTATTTTTIPLNTPIATIPKPSILSRRTSSLSSSLPPSLLDPDTAPPPPLLLALCVHHEFLLGDKSRWFGYLDSLPKGEVPIGVLWEEGKEEWEWCKGTELERVLNEVEVDRTTIITFYDALVHPFLSLHHPTPSSLSLSLPSFLHTYSLISSRAFLVDSYHSLSLVPLADIFNHQEPGENDVVLESEFWVCEDCGRLEGCRCECEVVEGNNLGGERMEIEEEEGVGMVKRRRKKGKGKRRIQEDATRNATNPTPLPSTITITTSSLSFPLHLSSPLPPPFNPHFSSPTLSQPEKEDPEDTEDTLCHLRLLHPVSLSRNSKQIFNTYGSLSNAHLIAFYGFMLEGNGLEKIDLGECSEELSLGNGGEWKMILERLQEEEGILGIGGEGKGEGEDGIVSESLDMMSLAIDAEARISRGLWTNLALRSISTREEDDDGDGEEERLVRYLIRLRRMQSRLVSDGEGEEDERTMDNESTEDLQRTTNRMISLIQQLCDAYSSRLYEPTLTADQVLSLAEETKDPKIKLAMRFSANERILISCLRSIWEGLSK